MKHVVLIAVLAGAAAGAGGAMVTTVLTMPVAPQEKGATTLASDGSAEIRGELAALREENRQLWDRVRFLEETQVTAAPARLPVHGGGPIDLAALEAEIASLKATLGVSGSGVPPATFAQVTAALESIEAEKERQREIEREQRALERVDQQVTRLTETLALDAAQARQMRDVLLEQSTRRDAFMQQMREGGDFGNAREEMRTLRDEMNARVSSILSPSQYEQYQETGGNDFGRGRGGFFRGADGGGSGGDGPGGGGGRGGRGGGG